MRPPSSPSQWTQVSAVHRRTAILSGTFWVKIQNQSAYVLFPVPIRVSRATSPIAIRLLFRGIRSGCWRSALRNPAMTARISQSSITTWMADYESLVSALATPSGQRAIPSLSLVFFIP